MAFLHRVRLCGRIHKEDLLLGEVFRPDALFPAALGGQGQRFRRECGFGQVEVGFAAGVRVGRDEGIVLDVFFAPNRERGVIPVWVQAVLSVNGGSVVKIATF